MPLPRWPIALLLLIALTPAPAKTLYVTPEGPGPDGSSWETAFPLVGDAIDAATPGDDIWVAAGRYIEAVTLTPGLSLYGGFAGTEATDEFHLRNWTANETILDATNLKSSVIRVVDTVGCLVDGFTITNGVTPARLGGGGFYLYESEIRIENCAIARNFAIANPPDPFLGLGGGVCSLFSTVFIKNSVIDKCASYEGGGVLLLESKGVVESVLFERNFGRGLSIDRSEVTLNNVTFGLKNIDAFGHRLDLYSYVATALEIKNSIILYGEYIGEASRDISHSIVPDISGTGNIDADPQWVDPENGDYRLKVSSPCIDSGTITDATMDLNGNPRPVDIVGIGRDGPGAYDMGAFEFQLSPADLTRNGTVDGEDLMEFQKQWMREN